MCSVECLFSIALFTHKHTYNTQSEHFLIFNQVLHNRQTFYIELGIQPQLFLVHVLYCHVTLFHENLFVVLDPSFVADAGGERDGSSVELGSGSCEGQNIIE